MSTILPFNGFTPPGLATSARFVGAGFPEVIGPVGDPMAFDWFWARQSEAEINDRNGLYISWRHTAPDTGDSAYVFTPQNTVDPTIEAGFTFCLGDDESEVGLIIIGTTGICKYVVHNLIHGNMPYQWVASKTSLDQVFADETHSLVNSASSRAGVLWLKMNYDTSTNTLTVYMGGDGVQYVELGSQVIDIGDVVSMGFCSQVEGEQTDTFAAIFSVKES